MNNELAITFRCNHQYTSTKLTQLDFIKIYVIKLSTKNFVMKSAFSKNLLPSFDTKVLRQSNH